MHIDEINSHSPDLVVAVGDYIWRGFDDESRINGLLDEFDRVAALLQAPLVMTPGNHDIWSGVSRRIYEERYGPTRLSLEKHGVHFLVLDSEELDEHGRPLERISDDQLAWLEQSLRSTRGVRTRFAFLHRPLWFDQTTGDRGRLWMRHVHPLLAKYGVHAVFAGDIHAYMEFPVLDRVAYFVCGAGPAGGKGGEEHGGFEHYCLVTVSDRGVEISVNRPGDGPARDIAPQPDLLALVLTKVVPLSMRMPRAGGQVDCALVIQNLAPGPIEVRASVAAGWRTHWEVAPSCREIVVPGDSDAHLSFAARLEDESSAYPPPRFEVVVTGVGERPCRRVVTPHLEPFQEAECRHASEPPDIDGCLEDAIWTQRQPLSRFWLASGEGPPRFATEVYTAWDSECLYIAFRGQEPNPAGLVASVTERNGPLWQDDNVEVLIDTECDRLSYFHFIANPKGVTYLARARTELIEAPLHAAGRVESNAWTLEAAIPWTSLGVEPPEPGKRMGLELARTRAQEPRETTHWAPTAGNSHMPERFGTMIFRSR